jgi:hypothetical protein
MVELPLSAAVVRAGQVKLRVVTPVPEILDGYYIFVGSVLIV